MQLSISTRLLFQHDLCILCRLPAIFAENRTSLSLNSYTDGVTRRDSKLGVTACSYLLLLPHHGREMSRLATLTAGHADCKVKPFFKLDLCYWLICFHFHHSELKMADDISRNITIENGDSSWGYGPLSSLVAILDNSRGRYWRLNWHYDNFQFSVTALWGLIARDYLHFTAAPVMDGVLPLELATRQVHRRTIKGRKAATSLVDSGQFHESY